MGAAAGKQFQSEKAKHAQAVLSAVELFDESNHQEQDSYGGVSTEFFKKKVMLAASDAKRKGKDIEKSLAQLTDADLELLAQYVENRKNEERRLPAPNSNTMQVEEIVDADNIDETTSVLSYGDDEEEAAENENDEMDSSGEILENIEETTDGTDNRLRPSSGFKVFPMDGADESTAKVSADRGTTPAKPKLKLEDATVRPGIADQFAKFWDYDELNSLASHPSTAMGGPDSPLSGALSPAATFMGKKLSPKQPFPYKDRGQRIDERNEALMELQRQKVISLTQNAQLEREVEALQRQLEKMEQLDQTFEAARLGNTGRSNASLNNTGNSSHTVTGAGSSSNNMISKYSYIYPIDEEHSEQPTRNGQPFKLSEAKASAPQATSRRNLFRGRDKGAKGGSSPSSSDNDSVNSYNNNGHIRNNHSLFPAAAAPTATGSVGGSVGGSRQKGVATGSVLNSGAQSKNGNTAGAAAGGGPAILRVRSNDQSDLSDEMPSAAPSQPSQPSQPSLGKVGKAHSIHTTGVTSSHSAARARRVRTGTGAGPSGCGNSGNYEGDSDDSAQLGIHGSRHAPTVGSSSSVTAHHHHAHQSHYHPSHPSQRQAGRGLPSNAAGDHNSNSAAQAKHGESDSENHESNIGRGRPQVLKSKRIAVAAAQAKTAATGPAHDDVESKHRAHDSDHSAAEQSPVAASKLGRARGPVHHPADEAKHPSRQNSSPMRSARDRDKSPVRATSTGTTGATPTSAADPKYQALLENVSLHLEAAQKQGDSATVGAAGNGEGASNSNNSSKLQVRGRANAAGGALKKLNKRRHSMDGLDENPGANSSNHISNTDTSQDELDAHSPSGRYMGGNKQRLGRVKGAGVDGSAVHRSPQATHINLGGDNSRATTDDEGVGAGAGRNKPRRLRANKLAVPSTASPSATTTVASGAENVGVPPAAAVAVTPGGVGRESVEESYQPTALGGPKGGGEAVQGSPAVEADLAAKGTRRVRQVGVADKSTKEKETGKESSAAGAVGGSSGGFVPGSNPWDTQLDQWWAEVSLLLRKPILQEEDMMYTVAAAEAGLIYTDEMNAIAKNLNVLRGALSRWILPYDNNTRIESQCSTPHSVVENMPDEFRGKLTERQVHYLVAGANGVRKLIRVKIADDNDLEQARRALKTTDMFFKALYHRADQAGISPYKLLQMAEHS